MSNYPNLEAMSCGCVSGRLSEWPMLPVEARKALAEIEQLRNCLELLHSVQNDCPLYKYEKEWNEAMAKAEKLLGL